MTAASPEWGGELHYDPEVLSPEGLVLALKDLAYGSERFRLQERHDISDKPDFELEGGTTAICGWRAMHKYSENGEEYEGESYELTVELEHTLENFMPKELLVHMLEKGVVPPDPDLIEQLEVGYALEIYLDDKGQLQWCEERVYRVMSVVDEPDGSPEEANSDARTGPLTVGDILGDEHEDDDDMGSTRIKTETYRIKLGEFFSEKDKRTEKPAHDDDIARLFEQCLGGAGISGIFQEEYLRKAGQLLSFIKDKHDADIDIAQFFDPETATVIRAGLNNSY